MVGRRRRKYEACRGSLFESDSEDDLSSGSVSEVDDVEDDIEMEEDLDAAEMDNLASDGRTWQRLGLRS